MENELVMNQENQENQEYQEEQEPLTETPEPEPVVDNAPEITPEMQAAVERLKKLQEDTKYWQQEKSRARADYFKSRPETHREEPPPKVEILEPEPNKDDFDDYDKWVEAKIVHETKKAKVQWENEQRVMESKKSREQREKELSEKLAIGFEEYPDFDEVYKVDVPITPIMKDILAELDEPHKVAYYLSKNRMDAIRIARLSPFKAAGELKRIEMEINKPENQTNKKRVTNAPPPIKPIVSGAADISKDLEKMSPAEFEQYMLSRGAKRY